MNKKLNLKVINPYDFDIFLETGKVDQPYSLNNHLTLINNQSINIIQGPAGSGKTTVCLDIAKLAQERKKIVMIVDHGYSINKEQLIETGLNIEQLVIYNPDYAMTSSDDLYNFLKELSFLPKNSVVIFDCIPEIKITQNLINLIKTKQITLFINYSQDVV